MPRTTARDRADAAAAVAFHIFTEATLEWFRGGRLDRPEILRRLSAHMRGEFADQERRIIDRLATEFDAEASEPITVDSPSTTEFMDDALPDFPDDTVPDPDSDAPFQERRQHERA
jgi:hypothetical protein